MEAGEEQNQVAENDWNNGPQEDHKGGDSGGDKTEDKKIFVGGLTFDTTNEDLQSFFSTFGEVVKAEVKFDYLTLRSRGFGFVEFATVEACQQAAEEKRRTVKGKSVEIKLARSRERKKVFVGGLPGDFDEEELKRHFEAYGPVEAVEWPYDKLRNVRRNFCFVVFETEEGADAAAAQPKHVFSDRECDVKKAVPQARRGFNMMGPAGMSMRGGRGGRGGYGGGGYNYGAYGGGMAAASGWPDWYGTNAGYNYYQNYYAANYPGYQQQQPQPYGSTNYEDYAANQPPAGSYDFSGQNWQSYGGGAGDYGQGGRGRGQQHY